MLRPEDLVIGTRTKWQALNTRKPVVFGTIIGILFVMIILGVLFLGGGWLLEHTRRRLVAHVRNG